MQSAPPSTGPGWLQDPSGRWAHRWFDGTDWTDQVSSGAGVQTDAHGLAGFNQQVNPPAPAAPARKRTNPFKIIVLLIVGGATAFIGLGLFLVAIGYEPEPNIETAAFVDGADLVSSSVGANGGTTWFVVVSPEATDAELTRIATDLVSTPEAAAIDSLEILFFDEAGRDLDEYIEALNELDELSQAEDLDLERILELSSTIANDWGMEHYVGTVQERVRSDAERFLGLCLEDLVSNCSSGTSIAIEPRN